MLTFHTDWLLENKTGFEILFFAQEISSKLEKVTTLQLGPFVRGKIRRPQNKTRILPYKWHILSK